MTENVNTNIDPLFSDSMQECSDRKIKFVRDKIPKWLSGSLIRNGPACFGTPDRRYSHLFDGLAKLSKYKFFEGELEFSAAFLKTEWYDSIVNRSKVPPSITTGPVIPPFSLLENLQAVITSSTQFDNVPVNLHQIGGKGGPYVCVTDAPVSIEFDPATLSTKGRVKFPNAITSLGGVELFSTAHPKEDSSGRTINYFLELNVLKGNVAHIVRTDSSLSREVLGSVRVGALDSIPYVHDISVTQNYAVLAVWPLRLNPSSLLNGKGFLPQLEWLPSEGESETRIFVFDLNKSGSSPPVAQYRAPPMFAYHHINAFETRNGDLVIDVSGYTDAKIVNGDHGFAYLDKCKDAAQRALQEKDAKWFRYELPLSRWDHNTDNSQFVTPRELPAVDQNGQTYTSELVTINPLYARKEFRFSYGFTGFAGAGEDRGGFLDWAIVKLDHSKAIDPNLRSTATAKIWKSSGCYPSEPIFVPRFQEGGGEDEGVLLSQVYDATLGDSFLLVLDAKDMTEIDRAYLGMVCPTSFHGKWIGM